MVNFLLNYEIENKLYLFIHCTNAKNKKKNRNAKIRFLEILFIFLVHRFEETSSGSSKISKLLVVLFLAGVAFDFEVLEDFVDASLKVSA